MPKRSSVRQRLIERYRKREAKLEKLKMLEAILYTQERRVTKDIDYIHDLTRRIHRLNTQLKNLSTVDHYEL